MVADVRLEAQHDRFGVIAEFLYFSLSDGIGSNGVVKKVDVQVDQAMADLALAWRIVATPRAWLDLTAGVRYMNFYQRAAFQPNDEQIGDVAGKLAIGSSAVRLARALSVLEGQDPSVPIAPLAAADRSRTARAIARVKGSKAEKQKEIADVLHATLSQTVARVDDWWDPYVGFRAHVDLSEKFYLAAKGDIGGFGAGSQLSWTAEGGLGTHLTNRVYSEIGYRAMGVDYRQDGLVMDTITHGILLNLGVTF